MLRLILVVTVCVTYVSCRPEPPSSYAAPNALLSGGGGSSYSAPSSSYGAPKPQYGPPAQAPTVHKHVYVHVPPPENEYPAARKPIQVPPAQKHYKIIFIKAPTPPTPTAPQIPVIPQDEEKTLVYVLVKKPEDAPEIEIPTPAPTQPSKPEVYFIRYKTQKEEAAGPYPAAGVPNGGGQQPGGSYLPAPAPGGFNPSSGPGPSIGGGPAPSGPSAPSGSYGAPSSSYGAPGATF